MTKAMFPKIEATSMPLLHRDAATRLSEAELLINTPSWEFTIREHVAPISLLLSIADGVTELDFLAAKVGIDAEAAALLLQPLAEEGVVLDCAAPIRASRSEFLSAIQCECSLLMQSLSEEPFWKRVFSGKANRSLILGWGIEFTHFVASANEYMPLGIAYAREGATVRELFSRHYSEEAEHSTIFMDGLLKCGLDPVRVTIAPPLASTRALINLLVENAIEGAGAYAAGFAIMQPNAQPTSSSSLKAFYSELAALYPFAAPLFEAFEKHANFDVELSHQHTVLAGMDAFGAIPDASRSQIVDAARSVAEGFILFFEGIYDAYGNETAEVPRRPARL
jgi:hypothetical protein